MNVESFNLDHRTVAAPYVRLADAKTLPGGDHIVKYDVRFTQPNRAHLEMPAVHSLEHLFAEKSRNHSDRVVDFSPMGCQTGFYLILQGDPAMDDVLSLIEGTLTAGGFPACSRFASRSVRNLRRPSSLLTQRSS